MSASTDSIGGSRRTKSPSTQPFAALLPTPLHSPTLSLQSPLLSRIYAFASVNGGERLNSSPHTPARDDRQGTVGTLDTDDWHQDTPITRLRTVGPTHGWHSQLPLPINHQGTPT